MFTGLVETTGVVTSLQKTERGIRIFIKPSSEMEVQIGDSICVNGVCLTVVQNKETLVFDISPETLQSTNLGELEINDRVNLERALRLSDRLGGHIVTGHVDGVGLIIDKRQEGEYIFYTFEAPKEILRYIVKKGSIAVDGISLTVIGLDSRSFSVAIIPHTLAVTNIGNKGIGDKVNLESDIIGKYVEKFISHSNKNDNQRFMELLKEKGFLK
jgi:riboflavin synthase